MYDFPVKAKNKLKTEGYKITSAREDVIEILNEADKPISPYEIQEELKKSGTDYKVITIYRILDLLSKLDLTHRIYSINSYMKCDSDHKHSHKFLVCENCHDIKSIDLKHEKHADASDNFKANKEINEVLGLCSKCD
jgi:Fur family transcriptional regulator, zinc uptake regulator